MRINHHQSEQAQSVVTFENRHEHRQFSLNSPLFSWQRWHYGFTRLGGVSKVPVVNRYADEYPQEIPVPQRVLSHVERRLNEISPMIVDKESQRIAAGIMDAISVHLEPVPET